MSGAPCTPPAGRPGRPRPGPPARRHGRCRSRSRPPRRPATASGTSSSDAAGHALGPAPAAAPRRRGGRGPTATRPGQRPASSATRPGCSTAAVPTTTRAHAGIEQRRGVGDATHTARRSAPGSGRRPRRCAATTARLTGVPGAGRVEVDDVDPVGPGRGKGPGPRPPGRRRRPSPGRSRPRPAGRNGRPRRSMAGKISSTGGRSPRRVPRAWDQLRTKLASRARPKPPRLLGMELRGPQRLAPDRGRAPGRRSRRSPPPRVAVGGPRRSGRSTTHALLGRSQAEQRGRWRRRRPGGSTASGAA